MRRLIASCYFEIVRLSKDRGFWFWSLIGMPVLVPLLVVLLAVVMSIGSSPAQPNSPSASPSIALFDTYSPPLSPFLEAEGLHFHQVSTWQGVSTALSSDRFRIGVHALDDGLMPRTLQVTTADPSSRHLNRTLASLQNALDAYYRASIQHVLETLPDTPASSSLLNGPPAIIVSSGAPAASRSSFAVTLVLWSWLLVLPYFQVARIGSSYVVSDLQRGLLSTAGSSGQSLVSFFLIRTITLASLGAILLLAYCVLMFSWMAIYSLSSDWLVANGLLQGLSAERASSMTVALVDVVAHWRSLPASFFLSVFLVSLSQLFSMSAILVAVSTYADSIPRSRLYEMLPFGLVFLVPLLSISFLQKTVPVPAAYFPGLNSVVLIDALSSGTALTYLSPFVIATLALFLLALLLTVRRTSRESFWLRSYS